MVFKVFLLTYPISISNKVKNKVRLSRLCSSFSQCLHVVPAGCIKPGLQSLLLFSVPNQTSALIFSEAEEYIMSFLNAFQIKKKKTSDRMLDRFLAAGLGAGK